MHYQQILKTDLSQLCLALTLIFVCLNITKIIVIVAKAKLVMSSLPRDLQEIILSYLCPTDENANDVLLELNTKFKTSLVEWTKKS